MRYHRRGPRSLTEKDMIRLGASSLNRDSGTPGRVPIRRGRTLEADHACGFQASRILELPARHGDGLGPYARNGPTNLRVVDDPRLCARNKEGRPTGHLASG